MDNPAGDETRAAFAWAGQVFAQGGEIGYRPPALPGSIFVNEVMILRVVDDR
jgi:hypothetical protein